MGQIHQTVHPELLEVFYYRELYIVSDADATLWINVQFSFEKLINNQWQLISIPEICAGKETVIINFIKNQKGTIPDLETELYADMACKTAIKDGDILDSITAAELIRKTMDLKNARCPHGRPVWFQVSREELFRFVGRI